MDIKITLKKPLNNPVCTVNCVAHCSNPADLFGGSFGFSLDHASALLACPNPAEQVGWIRMRWRNQR
jgi:hypothetical protein